jgi:hypothetical protein
MLHHRVVSCGCAHHGRPTAVRRKEHGEEDTYAFACAVADILYFPGSKYRNKDTNEMKYRDYCLPDMASKRTDKTSLEYVVWRMTQQAYANRLHDLPEMRKLIGGVTHLVDKAVVHAA